MSLDKHGKKVTRVLSDVVTWTNNRNKDPKYEIFHYENMSAYVEYYNEHRTHFSLDIRNNQTQLKAFHDRIATKAIRKDNPKWMMVNTND